MDKEKLQRVWDPPAQSEQELENLRSQMTILFSDIKGSTRYAEQKGDVEFMAMINRHNQLLFPAIEAEGGRIVKTIGDSILAKFDDPVAAIKAAAGMQRALAKDREGREDIDQIRIRIGLHYGTGLVKDDDVFGDVVNAAAHVQHQAETEQILITDVLLDAARTAAFPCARMGRAELKGKEEPIDLYAVAWSDAAAQQLIEEIQARSESNFNEFRKQRDQLEREFAHTREQWWRERIALNERIEELERGESRESSSDLHSQLHFQIQKLIGSRDQLEQDLASAHERFEEERINLNDQIKALQASVVDAMERSNNPARMSLALREQVEARVADAKRQLQLQWESERGRLLAEIQQLQMAAVPSLSDEKRQAARRAVLEKLGKLPQSSAGLAGKTSELWEREFQDASIKWELEREQLKLAVRKLEMDLQHAQHSIRAEIFQEIRAQYDSNLAAANLERKRLEKEVQFLTSELASERKRLNDRIKALEKALPEAQEAARTQVLAEFDSKIQEANRLRSRMERKHHELMEELEAERRRTKKEIATLQKQLKEAKEAAFKAQKASD